MILPVLLSEGVHRRGLPLRRVAELVALAPARIFNLYPRKGTIQIGSDADFTVVDLDLEREVASPAFQSFADYSIWDGQFTGEPGWGRYLSRSASNASIRDR